MAKRSQRTGFTSILCAVDFSLQSYAALQLAIQVAKRSRGHLTVLCVEDPLLGAGAAASGYDTALLRQSTLAQLTRLMERMAVPGLHRDAWTVETLLGTPARTIVAFARKMSADLIVMGTTARRGPAKLFFGSVVDAVLRRTPAPLLVVARSKPTHEDRNGHVRAVIGAIEFGEDERRDARRMARAAAMMGGKLELLHVVYRGADGRAAPVFADAYYERQIATARTRLEAIAKSVGAKSRVVSGRPEDEIAAAASDAKAGLIILALRKGRGIFGPRQGATTYRVLCTSAIPVLALPPSRDK